MIDEIIKKIKEKKDISESEIKSMIKKKQDDLSGLVSEEGAAYIVAKDLGMSLLEKKEHKLEIKNLISGMQNAVLETMVISVSDVYEFNKNNTKGKVKNLIIGDNTGSVRLSLWNEDVDKYDISEGDMIKVSGYVKEDNLGRLELRLGKNGTIEKSEGKKIDINVDKLKERKYERIALRDAKPGMSIENRAAIMDFTSNRTFYKVCPQCGKRVENRCDEHNVDGVMRFVISFIIDDGTDNIRAVMFNNVAESLFNKKMEELKEMEDNKTMDDFLKKFLNVDLIFKGRIQKNQFFDKPEIIVDRVKNINIIKEIERLVDHYNIEVKK